MAYCVEITYRPALAMMQAFDGVANCHLLRGGAEAQDSWADQWDIILASPTSLLSVMGEGVFLEGTRQDLGPFQALENFLKARPVLSSSFAGQLDIVPPPFVSGVFGHINYDLADCLEPSLSLPRRPSSLPAMSFAAYEGVIAVHRDLDRAFIFSRTQKAADALQDIVAGAVSPRVRASAKLNGIVSPAHSAPVYRGQVQSVIDHIIEGDIFQANLTQQFSALLEQVDGAEVSFLDIFCMLNKKSQANFGSLLQYEEGAILSNSPERYFSVIKTAVGRKVMMEPIKGTMPVYEDQKKNEASIQSLLKSEKDRAENIMIVDLVRNDLSKVCLDDTILCEKLCELKSYATVHHLVSRVSGILAPTKTPLDVLKASFPCGSITGAPKIKSMEVIAEIERAGRGVYCGAIGYFEDRGTADFSIPIRTTVLDRDKEGGQRLSYGSGGGITVLSDPEAEYQEIIAKSTGALSAMGLTSPKEGAG